MYDDLVKRLRESVGNRDEKSHKHQRRKKMKESTKFFIAVLIMTLIVILWFTCVFDSLIEYLIAIWTVFFLAVLGVCIAAVVAVLLYDYMVHK